MKILNNQQIQAVDKLTIQNEPIASIDLMERAASQCSNWLQKKFNTKHQFFIFCGTGNNGGDGLAIARLLFQQGYSVRCYTLCFSQKSSEDFTTNKKRLLKLSIPYQEINNEKGFPAFNEAYFANLQPVVFVDAIFGVGLNRPVTGWVANFIEKINHLQQLVIAIDIPSGLNCEGTATTHTIKAHYTLSLQLPKLAFLLAQNDAFVGKWKLLPIGLQQAAINKQDSFYYFTTLKDIQPLVKKRAKFSHKGTYGHCLILAGMLGKMGAALLCGKASLRTGTGLVTLHIPTCGYSIAQTAFPEAMIELNEGKNFLCGKWTAKKGVLAIGCGIGVAPETQQFIYTVIKSTNEPMVLDADALNILAKNPNWIAEIPKQSILTPHPKEFQRLVGNYTSDLEKLAKQKQFAKKYQVYLILKGAHTSIASPSGEIFFNSTGNPALAKGGSGDLLTGILAALLATGYSPHQSCLLGVYLHGLCGDLCIQTQAPESVIASDLLLTISSAWNYIRKTSNHF